MDLLPPVIRGLLPGIGSQDEEPEPFVWALLFVPDSPLRWYVIEGEFGHDGYVFRAFHMPSEDEGSWRWGTFRLYDLESRDPWEGLVARDEEFIPGPFTDAVQYPYANE